MYSNMPDYTADHLFPIIWAGRILLKTWIPYKIYLCLPCKWQEASTGKS